MKNTKIMAVLVVLLAAMLFVGAASAADATVTATTDSSTYAHGDTITLTIVSNTTITHESINITYAGDTFHPAAFENNVSKTTFLANATCDTIELSQNTTGSDKIVNLAKPIDLDITLTTRYVENQHDAFVFEYIYIIDGEVKLTKYSEGTNPTAVNQISGKDGVFYLTEAVVNGQYGAYYYDGNKPGSGTEDKYIYIWYPEISLQAELTTNSVTGTTSGDSINGKTINKNTQVSFLINSPKVAPALDDVTAKIVFTTPAGGVTTVFGDSTSNNLGKIPLSGTQTIALGKGMTIGDTAEPGTWTAQAEYLTAPFNDYAEKSNTVTFTVQSTALTVSAAKDSVIRSNPFTVTIQGDSQGVYFVYLDGASASDNNPKLQEGQNGYVDVAIPADDNSVSLVDTTKQKLEGTWGYFETDASGKRTVQYNTLDNTEDKTYTIKVYATGMKKAEVVELNGKVNIHGKDYDSVKVKVEKGAVTVSASGDGSYYIG